MIKNAFDWGEPFVFGVPDGQDREFFLEAGLELGEALKIGSPESVKRYAMRAGRHLLRRASGERVSAAARSRPEGHGRCGSPASRPGRGDVGLLAGRVGGTRGTTATADVSNQGPRRDERNDTCQAVNVSTPPANCAGNDGNDRVAGPLATPPEAVNCDPWQGQTNWLPE